MTTTMRYFLVFFASFAVVHCELKSGLRARFGQGGKDQVDKTIYFDLPKSVSEAVGFGWKKTARPEGPLKTLSMYCSEDRTVCTLFDDTENVCGVQIALEKSRITDQKLDWEISGFTSWTTDDGKEYWTQQQYFVNEDYLAKSKEERLASRDNNKVLQLGSIWVTGLDKKLIQLSTSKADIEDTTKYPFTKQACIPGMGQHFFYNVTTATECNSRGLHPWFLMTGADSLIATGFLTTGKYTVPSGERDWIDVRGNAAVLKAIVPNGPECFYSSDILTVHIFYVEEPWTITCPPQ